MDAEHATEGRLVTPNTSASLGTHVVTSLGSHGARVGGEGGVLTLKQILFASFSRFTLLNIIL